MTENLVPFKRQNNGNDNNNDNNNRHIVDRLADVRDQIAYLKGVESELKEKIGWQMGSRMSLGGDEYIAIKVVSERAGSIDAKLLTADGIDVDKYRKPPTSTVIIRLEERKLEA